MLYAIILVLISSHFGVTENLFAPNIFYSTVYVSSAQTDSSPEFAVDADFFNDQPTCFSTDATKPDVDGFHWILIDFGVEIGNIKEIRVAIQPDEQNNLQPLEAFVVGYLDIAKDQLNSSILPRTSLPWESPYFSSCDGEDSGSEANQAITLQCPIAYSGRWLAIRRRAQLHICLVNVYIERAFDECFEAQQAKVGRSYTGSVFRYIRHTPRKSCRSLCMQAIECEATLFTKQRLSGICQLITAFRIHDTDHNGDAVQVTDGLNCPSDRCIVEMNYCHGGTVQPLKKRSNQTDGNDTQILTSTALHEEEWFVKALHSTSQTQSSDSVYVLSVLFQGRLECEVWDCGPVYVALVDANQSEHFCGTIDTIQVSLLDKAILFCNNTNPIFDPLSVRVRWYGKNVDPDQPSPRLQFQIDGGNIRISRTRPVPKTTLTTPTPTTHKPTSTNSPISDSFTITNSEQHVVDSVGQLEDDYSQFVPSGPVSTDAPDNSQWTNELEAHELQRLEFNVALNDQEAQRDERKPTSTEFSEANIKLSASPSQSIVTESPGNWMHEKRGASIHASSSQLTSYSSVNNRQAIRLYVTLFLCVFIHLG